MKIVKAGNETRQVGFIAAAHQLKFHSQDPESEFSLKLSPNKLARPDFSSSSADLRNESAYAIDSNEY